MMKPSRRFFHGIVNENYSTLIRLFSEIYLVEIAFISGLNGGQKAGN